MSKCIRPPTSEDWHWKGFPMQHNLTDAELFTMASIDPRVVGRPEKYIPKLAFMFLTHGPLPLRPLWEEFFKGHEKYFSIYVHSNPESTQDFEQPSFFHGRMIPSQDVKWGDISLLDAERRLLGNALLDFTNERFILLSETCIPLHNFSVLYDYIIHSKHSFVGFTDDDGPVGKGRYNYNLEPEVTIDQFQKAPQWFEVNRKLALSIVKDTKYYSKFNSFCKEICYPDEHYIVTFLQIKYASDLANRSLTAADWSRFEPHPLLYLEEDITYEFIKSLRDDISCSYNDSPGHTCYMFARKFAQETLEPLLRLSHEILFNG
ncbi:hypothetical protein O6H91_Y319700 [Diphasiastrum complanatum]|nr:hypothetical protein O6H91_Y319700 [Diphasiastrum complanatum]